MDSYNRYFGDGKLEAAVTAFVNGPLLYYHMHPEIMAGPKYHPDMTLEEIAECTNARHFVSQATTSGDIFFDAISDDLEWGRRAFDTVRDRLLAILYSDLLESRAILRFGKHRTMLEEMHSTNDLVRNIMQYNASNNEKRENAAYIMYTWLISQPAPDGVVPADYEQFLRRIILGFDRPMYAAFFNRMTENPEWLAYEMALVKKLRGTKTDRGPEKLSSISWNGARPEIFSQNFSFRNEDCECALCKMTRLRPSEKPAAVFMETINAMEDEAVKKAFSKMEDKNTYSRLLHILGLGTGIASRYMDTSGVAAAAHQLRDKLPLETMTMVQNNINRLMGATQILTREQMLEIASDPEKWKLLTERSPVEVFKFQNLADTILPILDEYGRVEDGNVQAVVDLFSKADDPSVRFVLMDDEYSLKDLLEKLFSHED